MSAIGRRLKRLEGAAKIGARLIVISVREGQLEEQRADALRRAGIVAADQDLVVTVISCDRRSEGFTPMVTRVSAL